MAAALAALIGAAAAMAAAATGLTTLGAGVGKKMVRATIYLDQVGGECYINTDPQTLEAFKKETIEWSIIDRCGVTLSTDVEVEFANENPLEPSCVAKGKKKIRCTLKPGVAVGSYKYLVKGSGALTEDPELEIVQ
ncbi:MAG: hypothetical protein Q8L75_18690 [Acidobacteriota bacterium]|nr:hypothetical protein [Acidobacteriota bacterium]